MVVWNQALNCFQAVSEVAKRHVSHASADSKQNQQSQLHSSISEGLKLSTLFLMSMLPLAVHAAITNTALPTGAQVSSGTAQISQNHNTLTVKQNSQHLTTNWSGFNIGKDATVNFQQPNQAAVAVNYVKDANPSQIMGHLNANGQVFLLNPNGVVFSKTAQVNVGGIVASTLSLSDTDIKKGQYTLKGNPESTASIENHGKIQTLKGGTVALIAPSVKNDGKIITPNGTAHLSAASQVTLTLQNGSLTNYQIEQGVLNGLVENGGAIVAENGAIYLTAKAKNHLSKAVVNHSGVLEANRVTQNAKGEIILLADMQTGTTQVTGEISAKGLNIQDGGFIETSGAVIDIAEGAKISTLAETGKTGEWLIDPYNVTISRADPKGNTSTATTFTPTEENSIINVNTLNNALSSNNITVTTAGAGGQDGDINVDAAIHWNTPTTTLTLRADNNININADITNTNGGKVSLEYGQTTSTGNYYLNKGARVNLKAGQNFTTKKGNVSTPYTVITELGAENSLTSADLQGIRGNLSANYVLGSDIDASATKGWNSQQGFTPIGTRGVGFSGKFDGLGHTINNLVIDRPATELVSLFGHANGATIQNVGMVGGSIRGGLDTAGLIAHSTNASMIQNVFTTNKVMGTNNSVGGILGYSHSSTLKNAHSSGDISSNADYVGGAIGYHAENNNIENVYATGKVTGNNHVGGLVGTNEGSIKTSYASGVVVANNTSVGGLVGSSTATGTISKAYWNKETSGITSTGEGIGLTLPGMLNTNSFDGFDFSSIWDNANNQTTPYLKNLSNNQVFNKNDLPTGKIEPINRPALYTTIISANQLQNINQNLSGNYLLGADIDASNTNHWSGGFAPIAPIGPSGNGTPFTGKLDGLQHTINQLNINKSNSAVGLFAHLGPDSLISNLGLKGGTVKGSEFVGALAGINTGGNVKNSYASAAVTGNYDVGGLIGVNRGNIEQSYATGHVNSTASLGANSTTGGLVGWNDKGSIKNAYAAGQVTGSGVRIGGLVGYNNNGTVENTYAVGPVNASGSQTGGLIGNGSGVGVKQSYWNKETTGQSLSPGGGTALTTAEMLQKNKFDGFAFGTVWDNASNQTTPYLKDLANNQVFNKNDMPTGPITPLNRPSFYTALLNVRQLQNMNQDLDGKYLLGNNIDAYETRFWNDGKGFFPIATPVPVNYIFKGQLDGLNHIISDLYVNLDTTWNAGLIGSVDTAGVVIQNIGLMNADINGSTSVGGLVGAFRQGTIKNSFTTGKVKGSGVGIGGLVGYLGSNAKVENSYSTADVTGSDSSSAIGGLVGSFSENSPSIKNSYSSGNVSGGDFYIGGLVGRDDSGSRFGDRSGTVENSFWNVETSGQGWSWWVGELKTTAEMKMLATFSGTPNWSISNVGGEDTIWRIYEGQTAPLLRSFLTRAEVNSNTQTTTYNGAIQGLNVIDSSLSGLNSDNIFSSMSSSKNTGTYAGLGYYSNQQGYDFIGGQADLKILPKILDITDLEATEKAYDGTTDVVITNWGRVDTGVQVGGVTETLVLIKSGTASFNDKNANTGVGVTATGYSLDDGSNGGLASNYVLSNIPVTTTANIDKKVLTITGLAAADKVYDGNQNVTITDWGRVNTGVGGETLVLNGGTASFNDKNAATGVGVTATGYALANGSNGGLANNYALTSTTATTSADINKAKATVTANSKNTTYNATTQSVSGFSVSGLVGGDTAAGLTGVSASVAGQGAGKYINQAKGTDRNYEFTFVDGVLDIAKAKIQNIAGISALDKIYNANIHADLNLDQAQISGVFADDQVTVVHANGQFSDKNAGQDKTVNISNIELGGVDARNYELVDNTAQATADIDPLQLTRVRGITVYPKYYDGTSNVKLNLGQAHIEGVYAGDDVYIGHADGQLENSHTGKQVVNISNKRLAGKDAHNYILTDTTSQAFVDVLYSEPRDYIQAIQFKRPRYLQQNKNNLQIIQIEVQQDGINTTGLKTLFGEY